MSRALYSRECCGRRFTTHSSYHSHNNRHHPAFVCCKCYSRYRSQTGFNRHVCCGPAIRKEPEPIVFVNCSYVTEQRLYPANYYAGEGGELLNELNELNELNSLNELNDVLQRYVLAEDVVSAFGGIIGNAIKK